MTTWRPEPQQDPGLPEVLLNREARRLRSVRKDVKRIADQGVFSPRRARRVIRHLRSSGLVRGMSAAQLALELPRVCALLLAHPA